MTEQPCNKCGNKTWTIEATAFYFYLICKKCKNTQWRIGVSHIESISMLVWEAKALLEQHAPDTLKK